jgi:predicted transcriptional regulator
MDTPVDEVRRLLDTLAPEASFEDIQYHIYVQQAIRRGLDAAERGELIEQDEVERRMAKWLGE